MDRSRSPAPQHSTAVRTAGGAALDLLLSAAAREHRKPAAAPPTRPTVPEASVFRKPQNGGRVGGEPQAHPAADAHSGYRSPVSQTELEPGRRRVTRYTRTCCAASRSKDPTTSGA